MINKEKLIIKFTLYILCLTAVMFFWNCSIYLSQNLKTNFNSVSIRYENAKFTKQNIIDTFKNKSEQEDEKIPLITAWTKNNISEVKNESTDTMTTVNLMQIYGDMSLVISENIFIGNYVSLNDYNGCILDESTVYDLFGCTDTIGNSVYISNKNYIIRGIIKTKIHLAAIQIEDNQHEFNNMELVFSDKENGKSLAENFIYQNNFPKGYFILDRSFTISLLSDLYLFPSWFIVFIIIIKLFKSISTINDVFLKIIGSVIFVFISAILIFLVNFRIHIHDQLIPNKWSDLNFWVVKYNEFASNIKNNIYHVQMPMDKIYNKKLILYIITTIISCVNIILIPNKKIYLIKNLFKINGKSILNILLYCFILNSLIAFDVFFIFEMLKLDIKVPYCYWYITSLYTLVFLFIEYNSKNNMTRPTTIKKNKT